MSFLELSRRDNEIYRTLRERIVFVDYEPRDPLSESKIAEEFNCSRVPVREAFLLLEAENFIDIVPSQGTYASQVNLEYLQKNFVVRKNLVKLLGKLAAVHITSTQIDRLRSLVTEMEKEKDYKKLLRLDYRFHRVLHKASGNKILSTLLDFLLGHAVRSWIVTLDERISAKLIPGNFERLIGELERGDTKACAKSLSDHVQSSLDSLSELITNLKNV